MSVGTRVRGLRKSLALTQKEFATKIGQGSEYTYIGKIERDEQWPSIKFLVKIGAAHGKSLSYFFQDKGQGERRKAKEMKDRRNAKIKGLACLISRWNWELMDFRNCRRACPQMALCRAVKLLILPENGNSP